MTPHRIVEHLNEIEYFTLGFFASRVYLPLGDALLKRRKKAFSNSVVVAIAPATLRWFKFIVSHKRQLISTAVLAALVTVG